MELLELHLRDFPPADETDRLLMSRDIKMAEYADVHRPREERFLAVAQANHILEQLLEKNPDDPRRFDWLYTLAHSLIYDEAQPYFTSILYRGGAAGERTKLGDVTERALEVVHTLQRQLDAEYKQIDNLSISEFERMERTGYIERLDGLGPRTGYLKLWILFYDSLRRLENDPLRARQLTQILNDLTSRPHILNTPHDRSRLQIQSLLLAGMASRLLHDYAAAGNYLRGAIAAADRLVDDEELARVQWAVSLAWIERIRTDRDNKQFDTALRNLEGFRDRLHIPSGSTFGMRLVIALLERSIHQVRAKTLEQAGRLQEASTYREEAWRSLVRFARQEPDHNDEINAALDDLIPPESGPEGLDPFEQCALVAGLLFDAQQHPEQSDKFLYRAVTIGNRFLQQAEEKSDYLIPQVRYNVAVALYRLGNRFIAAQRFLEVAQQHPRFDHAFHAVTVAVRLAARLYEDSTQNIAGLQQFYRHSLEWLVTHYADTEEADEWRFYYAQLLDEMALYDEAALQYAMVSPGRQYDLESLFLRVRAMALSLQINAAKNSENLITLRQQANHFFPVYHHFVETMALALGRPLHTERSATLRNFLARGRILAAEISSLPQIDRTVQALDLLDHFEEEFSDQPALFGRMWRIRLMAYERLDRMEDAKRAIPIYVQADPKNAGPTLQKLYLVLSKEIESIREQENETAAHRKAELALILARQIYSWATRQPDAKYPFNDRALLVQLAEAHLYAGQYERAGELFEQCNLPKSTSVLPKKAIGLQILRGYAETQYQLGRYEQALPLFNLMAMRLPSTDSLRWWALQRDLKCRTRLNDPPAGIIQVIEQQKFLYPDLGGSRRAARLEKILRENQRRLDEK